MGIDMLTGGSIRAKVQPVSAFVWRAGGSVYTTIFDSGYFLSHRTLARENAALRDQLVGNTENSATISALRDENASLRELVHLAETERGITAPIVSSTAASPYGTFLVGAGAADDIQEGTLVLSPGGFVVGVIVHVGERESMAKEVLGAGEQVPVLVHGASLVLEGRGGGNARASAPRETSIAEGDVVLAQGFGGKPIAVVGRVDAQPSQAEAELYVSLPVGLSSLRYVFLVP